jgi:hypothetical protein
MTFAIMLLFSPDAISWPVKALAVVGGAFLGALATGLLVQLLAKLLTGQKVPRYPLWALRLLGGVVAGWLVALFVLGGGGFGLGGPGGWGFSSGTGDQNAKTGPKDDTISPKDKPSVKDKETSPAQVLRLEVLTDRAIEKLVGTEGVAQKRYYRIEGAEPNDLLTLGALKDRIRSQLDKEPPLRRLDIVIRKDSPREDTGRVLELSKWAEEQELIVAPLKPKE